MTHKIEKFINDAGEWTIYVFALSIFISKAVENITFALMMLLFLLKLIFFKKNIRRFHSIEIGIIVFVFIASLFNLFSPGGMHSMKEGLRIYSRLLLTLPFLTFVKNKKSLVAIIILSLISLVLMDSFAIYKWIKNPASRLSGVSESVRSFAHTIAIIIPFTLGLILYSDNTKMKVVLTLLSVTTIFLCILSGTRGSFFSLIIGGMFLVLLNKSHIKKILAITIIIVGTYLLCDHVLDIIPYSISKRVSPITNYKKYRVEHSSNLRFRFWEASLYTGLENPLFGSGERNATKYWKDYFKIKSLTEYIEATYKDGYWGDSHNNYLRIFSENGIVVFLLYIYVFIFLICRYSIKNYKSMWKNEQKQIFYGSLAGIIAFHVSGLTDAVIKVQNEVFLFSLMIAFFVFINNEIEKNKINEGEEIENINN